MFGPTIQPTLSAVLLKWRLSQYVSSTDIQKMYLLRNKHDKRGVVTKIFPIRETNKSNRLLSAFHPSHEEKRHAHTLFTVVKKLNAIEFWVKYSQSQHFPMDLKNLRNGKPVHVKSKIRNLLPTLDQHGAMRVQVRLKHALMPFAQKHPYIIHGKSTLAMARLIINEAHIKTLHSGTTLAYIRKRFWITNSRNVARFLI